MEVRAYEVDHARCSIRWPAEIERVEAGRFQIEVDCKHAAAPLGKFDSYVDKRHRPSYTTLERIESSNVHDISQLAGLS